MSQWLWHVHCTVIQGSNTCAESFIVIQVNNKVIDCPWSSRHPNKAKLPLSDFNQWLTPLHGWCFHRPSSTTSLRSFIRYTGWKLLNGFRTSSPFWFSNAAMERHRCTWSMNSFNPQTSELDPAYDQRRRHHCLSELLSCELSTIAARTCNAQPRHVASTPCQPVWRPTSFGFFYFCSACILIHHVTYCLLAHTVTECH